ncbi:MAG: hypothetical protein AAGE88_15690 [Actinomycetota bacterium]
MATLMEGVYGMGDTVASRLVSWPSDSPQRDRDPMESSLSGRIEQTLSRLLGEAEQLLRDNWYEVLSIAHALETHKTLAGEDVVAIIEGIEGELVDGRAYHTQEMRDELAAYHELAAAAHRTHSSSIEASLPTAGLLSAGREGEIIDAASPEEDPGR